MGNNLKNIRIFLKEKNIYLLIN